MCIHICINKEAAHLSTSDNAWCGRCLLKERCAHTAGKRLIKETYISEKRPVKETYTSEKRHVKQSCC